MTVSPTILSETGALRFFPWRRRFSRPWVLCRRSKSAPISLFWPARRILPSSLLSAPFPSVPVSSPFSPPFLFALLLKLQFVSCSVGMTSRGKSSVGKTGGRLEKRLRWKRIGPARFRNALPAWSCRNLPSKLVIRSAQSRLSFGSQVSSSLNCVIFRLQFAYFSLTIRSLSSECGNALLWRRPRFPPSAHRALAPPRDMSRLLDTL